MNIHIVTIIEGEQINNQFAYVNKEDADNKYQELIKENFQESLSDLIDEGMDEITLENWMNTESFQDQDFRVFVGTEEVVLEGEVSES